MALQRAKLEGEKSEDKKRLTGKQWFLQQEAQHIEVRSAGCRGGSSSGWGGLRRAYTGCDCAAGHGATPFASCAECVVGRQLCHPAGVQQQHTGEPGHCLNLREAVGAAG